MAAPDERASCCWTLLACCWPARLLALTGWAPANHTQAVSAARASPRRCGSTLHSLSKGQLLLDGSMPQASGTALDVRDQGWLCGCTKHSRVLCRATGMPAGVDGVLCACHGQELGRPMASREQGIDPLQRCSLHAPSPAALAMTLAHCWTRRTSLQQTRRCLRASCWLNGRAPHGLCSAPAPAPHPAGRPTFRRCPFVRAVAAACARSTRACSPVTACRASVRVPSASPHLRAAPALSCQQSAVPQCWPHHMFGSLPLHEPEHAVSCAIILASSYVWQPALA